MKDEDRARSGITLYLGQLSFPPSIFHMISFSVSFGKSKAFVIHTFKRHCLFLLLHKLKKIPTHAQMGII